MRRGRLPAIALVVLSVVAAPVGGCASAAPDHVLERTNRFDAPVELDPVLVEETDELGTALETRRSQRDFSARRVESEHLGRLLWAAQGVTDTAGRRTAPSAGARYPLEIYLVTSDGVGHYLPEGHRLESRDDTRTLARLGDAAFGQEFVASAPAVVVITGVVGRTEERYGGVAEALVDRESGHAAQNVLLQATALGLAAVPVGGFDPAAVAELLALRPGEEALYLIPVGYAG